MPQRTLEKLRLDLHLSLLTPHKKLIKNRFVNQAEILILSTELAGDFSHVTSNDIVLIGQKEGRYLEKLPLNKQHEFYQKVLFSTTSFVLLCGQQTFSTALQSIAKELDIIVFQSPLSLRDTYVRLSAYVTALFSPHTLFHGTLLEIYGQGVILVGKSGIGKSEVALELLKKGHRLVADDAIIIQQIGQEIHGRAPDHLKHFLEVRGIGLIDVYKMFGINSIADHKTIRYVIELDHLDGNQGIQRLNETPSLRKILQVEVPSATILVGGGRNIADLVEVAVTNLRLRAKGYNPTQELIDRHQRLLEGGTNDD